MRSYSVGRSSDADIVIDDPTVSRRHADFVVTDDGRYYLNDLRSKWGTFVWSGQDWTQIRQTFVEPNARIKLGGWAGTAADLVNLSRRR